MTPRAFFEIVRFRLSAERRAIAITFALGLIVGFIQPHSIWHVVSEVDADLATRSVWLAGPMFFCSALGIMLALAQSPGRAPYLDLCERGAPLFGRELARAKATATLAAALFAIMGYWLAQYLTGFAMPPAFFSMAAACVVASSLIALNATLREGAARLLYLSMSFSCSALAYALAVYADYLLGKRTDAIAVASELIFCAICAFIALRQYGEALARFEPITWAAQLPSQQAFQALRD